jgi:acyl carrier protein
MPSADETTQARVRRILVEINPSDREITPDARMIEDLGFHSLALLELMFACEEEFGLPPIEETAAAKISTVGDVESYVAEQVAQLGTAR